MTRALVCLLLTVTCAQAQQAVKQSGTITPGHAAAWVAPGVIKDAGPATNGGLTSIGVTSNGGEAICVNSAPTTQPFNRLCFSVSTNGGATISSDTVGGATSPGITFSVNGSEQGFPVVTGVPVTSDNLVCFDGTAGSLKDCGAAISNLPTGLNNVRLAKTANYTVQNVDGNKTIALGGSTFFELTFGAAAGYDSVFQVRVVNEDSGRGKLLTIPGLQRPLILWPLQSVTVFAQDNVWQVSPQFERWRPIGATTFYVRADGQSPGDTDGLANTSSGAFESIQTALNEAVSAIDALYAASGSLQSITIQVAAGTYNITTAITTPAWINASGNGFPFVQITGDSDTPGNVVLDCADYTCFSVDSRGYFISGFKLTGGSDYAFYVSGQEVSIGAMDFGSANLSHLYATDNALINLTDDYTISGGANSHISSHTGSSINLAGNLTVTLTGTPAFDIFAETYTNSSLAIPVDTTFTGSATGARFFIDSSSSVASEATDFLPGDAAGVITFGGHWNAISFMPVAFADLPTEGGAGTQAVISDSDTTTWGDNISGGGSDTVLAQFNGSEWTVIGK